jgi:hypothetical protein
MCGKSWNGCEDGGGGIESPDQTDVTRKRKVGHVMKEPVVAASVAGLRCMLDVLVVYSSIVWFELSSVRALSTVSLGIEQDQADPTPPRTTCDTRPMRSCNPSPPAAHL